MEEITKIVAEYYGVYYKVLRIKGRSNQKQAIAKQMAMVLISEFYPKATMEMIGAYFLRHHSTIVIGKKAMYDEIEVSRKRKADYDKLRNIIENTSLPPLPVKEYCLQSSLKIDNSYL